MSAENKPYHHLPDGTFRNPEGSPKIEDFGFKWSFLKWFTNQRESPLEITESCDSNRIYDGGFTQRAVIMPYRKYFSVDSPGDLKRVEEALLSDIFSQQY